MSFLRKTTALLLMVCLLLPGMALAQRPLEEGTPMTLTSPAVILAETSTGTIIFEKNADEKREVASITKLMTALLVLEALDRGEIHMTDSVQVSQNAAAMKGSQALLDANAVYSLEDLLRTTIMASANDSAVALAEYLCGSEEAFVSRMNERAAQLGMTNTHYVNATGYPQDGQYTTARDVCTLCCEVSRYPLYTQYSSVWIDKLTHPGGRVTDLTNTNRLVRFYEGCDGFKTGSTDAAKYCLAATAEKNGMRLVAIVLGTPVSQTRFDEARAMLDYGFANYQRIAIANRGDLLGESIAVKGGAADSVELALGSGLSMLLKNGQQSGLRLELSLPDSVEAPISEGDVIGTVNVLLDGQAIAKLSCVAASNVPRPGFIEGLYRILENWR
ncbi:MAG: D-alanyl-D-alanine carboxypeptidase [Clostridia bacterium]|nr:D-alanyl-D-alanine carboxypeptidase [Clostridia bacterium]